MKIMSNAVIEEVVVYWLYRYYSHHSRSTLTVLEGWSGNLSHSKYNEYGRGRDVR